MSLYERTGTRSLLYSGWHRPPSLSRFLPKQIAYRLFMVDIDACEYCDACRLPLALIETQHSRSNPKTPSRMVTATLARMAGIPAYSVSYWSEGEADIEGFKVRRVEPRDDNVLTLTPAGYSRWLLDMRLAHDCGGWNRYRQEGAA